MTLLLGFAWALLWQYPLSVGIERALLCKTKLQWIKTGRHPKEELHQVEREYWLKGIGASVASFGMGGPVEESAPGAVGFGTKDGADEPGGSGGMQFEVKAKEDNIEKPPIEEDVGNVYATIDDGDVHINRQTSITAI